MLEIKKNEQLSMDLEENKYKELYDMLVPKNNKYRVIKDSVDFSFIVDELKDNYCLDNGRKAINPILLIKYLIIKDIEKISDEDLVKRSLYDLSLKYFLDLKVDETNLIDSSTLTKFRKLRLKNKDLMNILLKITVELGIRRKIIKNQNTIIVDSTHTKARYNQISPREMLIERAKLVRKAVYAVDAGMKEKFPKKVDNTGIYEDQIKYCQELIKIIKDDKRFEIIESVQEKIRYLEEGIKDIEEKIEISYDGEARTGHKTADTNFFGYKTHIAVTEEGIAVGAVVSSGEKTDGQYLEELVEQSKENGIEVKEVIGDKAYSSKSNIDRMKERNIKVVARLSGSVVNGNREKNHGFEYNKDAGMYQCPAGHLSIRKVKSGSKDEKVNAYFFDVEKCKICPMREGCYKGTKTKTFNERIKDPIHLEQLEYEKSEEFQEKIKKRYVIEQSNAILKNNHGYGVARSKGLEGLEIQGAIALFCMNLQKILYPSPPRKRNKKEHNVEKEG